MTTFELVQNESLKKSLRKKKRIEVFQKQVQKDADLDQYRFQQEELKFPYTNREKKGTLQVLKEHDELQTNQRDRYSNSKRSKKLLGSGAFISKNTSQTTNNSQKRNKSLYGVGDAAKGTSHPNEEGNETLDQQKIDEERINSLNLQLVHLRNNLYQKGTNFEDLYEMVHGLSDYFPLSMVSQKERDFIAEARKPITNLEQLKD